jgi:bacteriocin-like protein
MNPTSEHMEKSMIFQGEPGTLPEIIEELSDEELQRIVGGAGPIVPDSGPGFQSLSQQRLQHDRLIKRGGIGVAVLTTTVGLGVGIYKAIKH